MAIQGGPSEIGSISFGLNVDTTGASAGFAKTRAEAASTAGALGVAGVAGGRKYAAGLEDGLIGGLGAMGRARRILQRDILGLLAVPFVATGAFKAGNEVFDVMWKALASSDTLRREEQIKNLQEAFERARTGKFGDVEASLQKSGRGVLPGEIQRKSVEATEATLRMNKLAEARSGVEAQLRDMQRWGTTGLDDKSLDEIKALKADLIRIDKELLELAKQRADAEAFVNEKLRTARELSRAALESKLAAVQVERAERAQGPGRIDTVGVNISRIRALLEISTRQRLPIDPGNGIVPVYGGGGP